MRVLGQSRDCGRGWVQRQKKTEEMGAIRVMVSRTVEQESRRYVHYDRRSRGGQGRLHILVRHQHRVERKLERGCALLQPAGTRSGTSLQSMLVFLSSSLDLPQDLIDSIFDAMVVGIHSAELYDNR
jgi:hypothetical protein